MRTATKATRTGMRRGLQAGKPSNRWGIALLVCLAGEAFSSDYAHQEPTKGGLIDH